MTKTFYEDSKVLIPFEKVSIVLKDTMTVRTIFSGKLVSFHKFKIYKQWDQFMEDYKKWLISQEQ